MGSPRPLIGICARMTPVTWHGFDIEATLVLQTYVDPVTAAGCMPVLLPVLPGVEHAIGRLDGLLLPGGRDLSPVTYGATAHEKTNPKADQADDAIELAILDRALSAGLPMLGICRGLQLLNVLRGGTLHQHLPEIIGDTSHQPARGSYGPQLLKLLPGSHIDNIFGGQATEVPCHHHQAIDQVGTGLVASAWAQDGVIEAVEATDHPFAVGVQWHADRAEDQRPFLALAEAAGLATIAPGGSDA